jgi:hypothetical protein
MRMAGFYRDEEETGAAIRGVILSGSTHSLANGLVESKDAWDRDSSQSAKGLSV